MPDWAKFRRKQTSITEMTNWSPNFDMDGVSVGDVDEKCGSPKAGDMIARNPDDHEDMWLVSREYFLAHYDPVE